ncbi:MAG: pyridoxal phosphate-dependent aminotransferase [Pseudomonadota bacterium]
MKLLATAPITQRLAALGSECWAIHFEGRRRIAAGDDIIELTIGEPDVPTPPHLIAVAEAAMRAGRTRYASGKGEPGLLAAVARKYTARTGRSVTPEQVLVFPGTQAALAICMMSLVEAGDDVLVPDPYYATYEGVVRATGANFVPVPMSTDNGFHLTAAQVEKAVTPQSKVLLLNSPHNPTGAVLDKATILEIGAVCEKHGLWIISDEVYEPLTYDGDFASPFNDENLASRTIAMASISKSHAAPGFRSGWAVGPQWVMDRIQSVSEALLFGTQPFIADMTAHALDHPDTTAEQMGAAYQQRISLLMEAFSASPLKPLEPKSGMFMLVDVSACGITGEAFAKQLLDDGVSVMPGNAFGKQADHFIRLSLTVDEEKLAEAAGRIVALAERI